MRELAFEPATEDGQPVPSTTSAWAEYVLESTEEGFKLTCTDFGDGPRFVERVAPPYPKGERLAGRRGEVKLRFMIDGAGNVTDAGVLEATNPELAKAALKAVRKWRFHPRTVNGKPAPMEAVQTITFEP